MVKFGYVALLAFIVSVPWEKAVLLPGVGTGSRLVGIVAFPLCLIAVVRSGRVSLPWPIVLLAAFVALAALSLSWTPEIEGGVINIQTYVQLLLMTWLATQLIDSEPKLQGAFLAYVLGGYVAAMSTVNDYMTTSYAEAKTYLRYAVEGTDPNDTALRLSVAIAMAGYLVVWRRGWWRLIALGFIPLGIYGVLLSGSRAGFIAMLIAASLPVLMLLRPRHFGKAMALGLAGFAIGWVLLVNYVPERSWDRIETIGTEVTEGDLSGRYGIWAVGLEIINEAPILGVGIAGHGATMQRITGWSRALHNGFLTIAAEHGVVGLLLVLAIWGLVIRDVLSMPAPERLTWLVLLLVVLTAVMSSNWELKKATWLILAMALAHARCLRSPLPLAEGVTPDLPTGTTGRSVRALSHS